ncbi:hypothetical protein [Pseudomonas amygdali]|uniref:hypothetical protein n=1 Tax=Pseudomonas amygdali TaxID=47877 RepID=UPI001F374E4D|nr:hypothetical protein [Pseudomonas amygdali]
MMGTFQSALKFQNIGFWQANDSIDHEKVVRVAFILLDHFSLTALSTAMDALATGNLINSNTVYKVSTYSLQGGLIESDIGIPLPSERLNVEKSITRLSLSSADNVYGCPPTQPFDAC